MGSSRYTLGLSVITHSSLLPVLVLVFCRGMGRLPKRWRALPRGIPLPALPIFFAVESLAEPAALPPDKFPLGEPEPEPEPEPRCEPLGEDRAALITLAIKGLGS